MQPACELSYEKEISDVISLSGGENCQIDICMFCLIELGFKAKLVVI